MVFLLINITFIYIKEEDIKDQASASKETFSEDFYIHDDREVFY